MLGQVRPLPSYLIQRFHGWKATTFAENRVWYRRLAEDGQHPRAMVISCCDSRVHVTSIFGADQGEFFIHRNIASLVPPYSPDGDYHGTSAAVEYAVNTLKVAHLIVLGHSQCGGVLGCHAMCTGQAPELERQTSFVGKWLGILRPGFERVADLPEAERVAALEREAVVISLENLMTFPFLQAAVADEAMTLHGLWHDIAGGQLLQYDPASGFVPI
jgi:carbonic anhydrase